MTPWTAGRLAARVGATCEGDPDRLIEGVATLDGAGPRHLAFCSGPRHATALARTGAGAVLLHAMDPPEGVVALRHPTPRAAFAAAAAVLAPAWWPEPGVHPRAWVAEDAGVHPEATVDALAVVEAGAVIEAGAWIGAHAYVGRGARVGAGSRLMPTAVVMEHCVLGERVLLQPGAVVGSDGFGHAVGADGLVRVPQLGRVVLDDGVEVGANACVDRAALGETRVGRDTRLDNLVQVAHGVRVGAECLMAAFVGLAGSAVVGRGVHMGGRAAVLDGVEVGDGSRLAALASATRDVPPGSKIAGSPGRPHRKWLREVASLRRLPALVRQLEDPDP